MFNASAAFIRLVMEKSGSTRPACTAGFRLMDINRLNGVGAKHPVLQTTQAGLTHFMPGSSVMNNLRLKWRVRMATGLMWLLVIGFDAAVAIIAVNRNMLLVLIPFAIATLVSLGAVWWAQHCNGERAASPPFSGGKITPYSSPARPTKPID
jgi:hypothetical protein